MSWTGRIRAAIALLWKDHVNWWIINWLSLLYAVLPFYILRTSLWILSTLDLPRYSVASSSRHPLLFFVPPQNHFSGKMEVDPSHTMEMVINRSSNPSVTVSLHPLVILNISEQWIRARVQAAAPDTRIHGKRLGWGMWGELEGRDQSRRWGNLRKAQGFLSIRRWKLKNRSGRKSKSWMRRKRHIWHGKKRRSKRSKKKE